MLSTPKYLAARVRVSVQRSSIQHARPSAVGPIPFGWEDCAGRVLQRLGARSRRAAGVGDVAGEPRDQGRDAVVGWVLQSPGGKDPHEAILLASSVAGDAGERAVIQRDIFQTAAEDGVTPGAVVSGFSRHHLVSAEVSLD